MTERQEELSVPLTRHVREARSTHGLKHGDYLRYRKYCAKRLRRIYKSTRFLHGRGNYQKRDLLAEDVKESRMLLIPLVSAERCWAHAAERKQHSEATQRYGSITKHHCARRLKRGVQWAEILSDIARKVANARTALEAEAYASFMAGNFLVQLNGPWDQALQKLTRSKIIYEALARSSSNIDDQIIFKQQIEEIEPVVHFCSYNLQGTGGALPTPAEPLAFFEEDLQVKEMLQGILASNVQGASIPVHELKWWSITVQVHSTALQIELGRIISLREEIALANREGQNISSSSFSSLLAALSEGKSTILAEARNSFLEESTEKKHQVDVLQKVLRGMDYEAAIAKGFWEVERLCLDLEGEIRGPKRHAILEQVNAIHDGIIEAIGNLADLGTGRMGEGDDEVLLQYCNAELSYARGSKSLYIGKLYENVEQHLKAYVLFDRSLTYAEDASENCIFPGAIDSGFTSRVARLSILAEKSRLLAHTQWSGQMDAEELQLETDMKEIGLRDKNALVQPNTMVGNLEEFLSPLGKGKVKFVTDFPPKMRAIPIGPIFVDAAMEEIVMPDLGYRTEQSQSGNKLGRLFGW